MNDEDMAAKPKKGMREWLKQTGSILGLLATVFLLGGILVNWSTNNAVYKTKVENLELTTARQANLQEKILSDMSAVNSRSILHEGADTRQHTDEERRMTVMEQALLSLPEIRVALADIRGDIGKLRLQVDYLNAQNGNGGNIRAGP